MLQRIAPLILLLCLAASHTLAAQPAPVQPNVILLITDDQGYGDVGFHGNTVIQTPTLDAFARQSIRLTNFHVEPTCAETRSALMSGQFPLRVGVWHTIMGRSIMNADAVTMPQLFQAAGYRTGMFGKWHLGDNYPYRPQDRGFQTTLHHGGGGVGQTPDVWGNDYFDDVYWSGSQLTPVRGYCTDVFFDAAKKFVTTQSDQPFFCYLATNAPHGPYLVDEAYKKPYLDQGLSETMASFYGMITNIDDNLDQLLKTLDEQQLTRDTIVIYMTDNGTAAGFSQGGGKADTKWQGFNAGMRGTKGTQYDGGHRVPCFIRLPDGKLADTEFASLSAHIDLIPTLAGLCGIDTEAATDLDGVDLMPFISGEQEPLSRTLVAQSHRVEVPRKWIKSSVMTDTWRFVDGKELYAINEDAGQLIDVAAENPEVVSEMRQAYEAWWQDCTPDADQYARIPLGDPAAPMVCLTAHDWHGPAPPWNQAAIRKSPNTNGDWEVTVKRAGAYQFWLTRQPLAEPRPLECSRAVVRIGEAEATLDVEPSAVMAPLVLELPVGDARLTTELIDAEGNVQRGAFYVYASYLEQQPAKTPLPPWLAPGDRIAWIGGTLIERAQESGQLEAQWLARAPLAGLTFCNLGWSGDDVRGRARNVFGDLQEGKARRLRDLDLAAPSVVVVAYGMSEAFDETLSAADFLAELSSFAKQQIEAGRRVALCRIPEIIDDTSTNDASSNIASNINWAPILAKYARRRSQLNEQLEQLLKSNANSAAIPSALPRMTLIDLPSIHTGWFESAQYVGPQGYAQWSSDFAASAMGGESQVTESQIERIATLAREANRQFFEMHRPQNETYMYLFRKHEQGNNGVEPFQNRPLLAESQLEMLRVSSSP